MSKTKKAEAPTRAAAPTDWQSQVLRDLTETPDRHPEELVW